MSQRPPHHLVPPPELPSSSRFLIPALPLPLPLPREDPPPPAQCDYAPLWECIVNGNGGCEALEAELRECQARARKPEPEGASQQCDYAPLWECIVNGNGGCEVLEEEFRACLERSRK